MFTPIPNAAIRGRVLRWDRAHPRIPYPNRSIRNRSEHAGRDNGGASRLRILHELERRSERRRHRVSPAGARYGGVSDDPGSGCVFDRSRSHCLSALPRGGVETGALMSTRDRVEAPRLWIVLSRCYRALSQVAERSIAEAGLCLSDFAALEAL